jgi:methyl-accepting chemotaxis protein
MGSAKLNGSAEINQSFENGDDEVAANGLEDLLRRVAEVSTDERVAEVSTDEIENLIDEFHGVRKKLQTDLSRIQRDIAEYRELSQAAMQLTVSISDGMKKLQAAQRLFDTRTS